MSNQLARGLYANFAPDENPFGTPNGMEDNLRHLDDHIGLYTLQPPVPIGTPYPPAPIPGDGQIYTNGDYAVYNVGGWILYPARRGLQARMFDGSDVWLSTGAGGWISMRQTATLDAATVARDIYPSVAAGVAGVADGAYFTVPSADPNAFVDLYQRVGAAGVLIKSYPSYTALVAGLAALADGVQLAQDWAISAGLPDGENKSSRSYALDAAAFAEQARGFRDAAAALQAAIASGTSLNMREQPFQGPGPWTVTNLPFTAVTKVFVGGLKYRLNNFQLSNFGKTVQVVNPEIQIRADTLIDIEHV